MRAQSGDENAFVQLFEAYKTEAVRTAYLLTSNASICEDIAQEAFVTCFVHMGSLKNPKAFRAWFYRILTRVAWKQGSLSRRELAQEDIIEKSDKASIKASLDQYAQSEANKTLYAEIATLSFEQKAVITLYYFSGLSTKEIATVLHCFEGTVKSRLHAARQTLKKSMESWERETDEKERLRLA